MSNVKIENLRQELNSLITNNANFDEIQRVSQLLDECIVEYYNDKIKER